MSFNIEKINEYAKSAHEIEKELFDKQELFNGDIFSEFQTVTSRLERNAEEAQNENRKLKIGIVGAMKSGKSSFLNALLFGGKDYLPKAATPMTAALTKISYSDKPKAIVHFYEKKDWNDNIVTGSEKYDQDVERAYNEYLESTKSKKKSLENFKNKSHSDKSKATSTSVMKVDKTLSKDEFEIKQYKCTCEKNKAAHELTSLVRDEGVLLDKLGTEDVLEGDVMLQLNEYVGANGKYTAIVSYVELQVNIEELKDYVIVDTPGLSDPVVSRTVKTKEFLRDTDVVLLLSPVSQFMDASTTTLVTTYLKDVAEVIIIGSKLDSGVLNESRMDFKSAVKKSIASYDKTFHTQLDKIKAIAKDSSVIEKLSNESIFFVSSTCYSIAKKQANGIPLNGEELKIIDSFNNQFSGFNGKEHIAALSGIKKVKPALNAVVAKKEDLFNNENNKLLNNTISEHAKVLDKILAEIVSSRQKLEESSAGELRDKVQIIKDTIDSSRIKLNYIFEGAIIDCESKVQQLLPQLTKEQTNYTDLEVRKYVSERENVDESFWGLRKKYEIKTIIDHTAETSEVCMNVKLYAARCEEFVKSEYKNIFNKELFSQRIKELMLTAFEKSKRDFDEDDILMPLQNVLKKISIPTIRIPCDKYLDEVEATFSDGYAKNEDVHKLKKLQIRLIDKIEYELGTKLKNSLQEIGNTLKNLSFNFADTIQSDFCKESEKLESQIAEKEMYCQKYMEFAEIVKELKKKLVFKL